MLGVFKVLLLSLLLQNAKPGNVTRSGQSSFKSFSITIMQPNVTEETPLSRRQLHCAYAPGLAVGNRDWELRCCSFFERRYEYIWASLNQPLSRYLQALKDWRCPEFETECDRRLFATTPFTRLLYDYFCSYNTYVEECFMEVKSIVTAKNEQLNETVQKSEHSFINISVNSSSLLSQWSLLKSHINTSQLTIKELLKPCIQVAQYDMEEVHNGDFQELSSIEVPSCEQIWCGFSGDNLNERVISLWTCMSSSCHTKIIIIMVACGIMALAIAIVNFSVIVAIVINPPLQHSQSTYKISLAVADLLVGVVVLPTCISNLARLVWTQHVQEGFYNVEGYEIINGTLSENVTIRTMRELSGKFSEKFPPIYRNSIGFFTAVSVFVSVYTLAGAGFDRLIAVMKPLSYRKDQANKAAKWTCLLSWILAIVFASLSFFLPSLSYGLILSVLITNVGQNGIYLYTAAFIFPLIIVWVVNVLTFKATQKHSKFRRQLTASGQIRSQKVEHRLARTLTLMVGVFSINTLPLIILLVGATAIPTLVPAFPRLLDLQVHYVYIILQFITVMLLFSNSFWNFFIYSFRNMDFRIAVKGMYRNASKRIGGSSWWDSTVSRFRKIAHDGRRRVSSLPSLSTYSDPRKKSSIPTLNTKESSSATQTSNHFEITNDEVSAATQNISSHNQSVTQLSSPQNVEPTFIEMDELSITDNKTSKKHKRKHIVEKKNKQEESSYAGDDSIFRSFAVDANADRLFESVMENIEENITLSSEKKNTANSN